MDDKKGVFGFVGNYPWVLIDAFLFFALLTVLAVGENEIKAPSPFLLKFVVFSIWQFWFASLHLLLVTRSRIKHLHDTFDPDEPKRPLRPTPPLSGWWTGLVLTCRAILTLTFTVWLFIDWPSPS